MLSFLKSLFRRPHVRPQHTCHICHSNWQIWLELICIDNGNYHLRSAVLKRNNQYFFKKYENDAKIRITENRSKKQFFMYLPQVKITLDKNPLTKKMANIIKAQLHANGSNI